MLLLICLNFVHFCCLHFCLWTMTLWKQLCLCAPQPIIFLKNIMCKLFSNGSSPFPLSSSLLFFFLSSSPTSSFAFFSSWLWVTFLEAALQAQLEWQLSRRWPEGECCRREACCWRVYFNDCVLLKDGKFCPLQHSTAASTPECTASSGGVSLASQSYSPGLCSHPLFLRLSETILTSGWVELISFRY